MADDIFRYFLKQMFPLYYTKCGFIKDSQVQEFVPKGALSKTLFTLILKSTCMLQDSIFLPWKTYLDVHKKLMLSSPEMYVAHVMRICLTDTSATTEIFEKLINVFGLVTTIGIATYGASRKKFYKMNPEILAVIFENKLEYDFKKCGGFKKFEKYLSCQDFIRFYDEKADYIDGSSPDCPHDTMQKLLRRVTERLVNFSVNVQLSSPKNIIQHIYGKKGEAKERNLTLC
ncbi:hypothetical protein TNIN_462181 [Trichonephila inaurata madagascariensis]|uniref:Uncharacterized protein n=1 Tax=Trichonephila inaurata madagascariensis TaxID=2747483 RepID=A0A8X7CUU2_9ARAC|nr:hypothetical protein TNIN_462181 [Trichonephila inaurata madagascariensis]